VLVHSVWRALVVLLVLFFGVAPSFANTQGQCNDGLDNDGDGLIDYPFDPGCYSLTDLDEANPLPTVACNDGLDNDGDGLIDHLMRPWWKKERTYSCYAGRVNDLSFAADRYEKIHGSFDSDSGEFSDRRKDAQGTYQVHSETTSLPAADPQDCIQVCKTQKPRPGVSMGDVGAVGDSPAWDYSYYECDAGGNCPAPSNETVIEACGCGSSFKEAFLYMQMINQMKSDFLCTD